MAVVVAGSALWAGQRATREQTIYVSVTDKDGTPATDLSPANFTVREDGATREVLTVAKATAPQQIALLIDTSQVTQGATADLRDAVKAFATTIWAQSPDSQVALYTFGERPQQVVTYTSEAPILQRGVDRLFATQGSGAYFLEAIVEAAGGLRSGKATRPAIVAYVDENGPEFSNRRHDQVFDALSEARASLWTIARQSFGSDPMTSENRERASVLGDVTTRSGGRNATIFAPSSLKERFTAVARDLLNQWAVTYGRPESLIPPEKLEVRLVKADGYRLTAPRWTNK